MLTGEQLSFLQLELARHSLAAFVLATLPTYQMGHVHEILCIELDNFLSDVISKKSPRLMLTMPPRHGKSELASRRFPAYCLGRYPDLSIIATSYSADLASRLNRDVQRIMDGTEYQKIFPKVKLPSRRVGAGALRTSDLFEVCDYSGSYRSAGVGGGITGMGGNILIVDDPFKDRQEADSATIRERVWEWYSSTFYTRLAPGGGIVVINTRWHLDDLSGRLLENARRGGDQWRVVDFPAIATQDEGWRKEGEPLHAERYSLEELLKIKRAIGTRDWEALYQQHPTPDGGAVFHADWLKFYEHLPKLERTVASWDLTFKDAATSDFVVGQVWGTAGPDFFLVDQVRGRWDFTETLAQILHIQGKWKAPRVLIEDKANGPAIISVLKKQIPAVIPVEPDGSKVARAYAVTSLFEGGNVFLPPKETPWISDFIAELISFPSAAHDDQVDAMTQALRDLTETRPMVIAPSALNTKKFPYRGRW